MSNSSISTLIYTKRKVLLVLVCFSVVVIFFSTAVREIKISQDQANSVSSFIIESIRKLSSAGELLYAQRELDAVAEKMKFAGDLNIVVSVADTKSILARIDSQSDLMFYVEKKEEIQAIPFGLIAVLVKIDVVGKIVAAILYALFVSLLLVFGFLVALFYLERNENRFLVPLGEALSWIQNLDLSKHNDQQFMQKQHLADPNLRFVYNKIRTIVDENTKLQLNDQLILQAKQVAHDIRSPLSVLNMLIPSLTNESGEKQELIMQSVARINSIADDLLRKQYDSFATKCRNIDEIIRKIVAEKSLLLQSEISFELKADSLSNGPISIEVSESEFSRMMSNLINNAIEALPKKSGKIVISIQDNEKDTSISIIDNGKGIPKFILQRMGERGVTFGKDGNVQSGSGLGVFSAMQLMTKAGGTFDIRSEEKIGTTIVLKFPKHIQN